MPMPKTPISTRRKGNRAKRAAGCATARKGRPVVRTVVTPGGDGCPQRTHPATAISEMRTAARSRAEAARGLRAISAGLGRIAPRVNSRSSGRSSSRDNGQVAWRAISSGKAEDLLDQPVLERVVGQHGDPTMKRERRDGTRQHGFERFELGVHLDPESLKRPLRGMATGLAGSRRDRVIEQLDESTEVTKGSRSRSATIRRAIRSAYRSSP